MDGHRFDQITKHLVTGSPRRQALRLLGGAIAGGLAGALGLQQRAAAACDPPCTSGCCLNSSCVSGTSNGACGTGGAACQICLRVGVTMSCQPVEGGGRCTCDDALCAEAGGCCEGDTCNTDKKPCGDQCIDKDECCTGGVQGCASGSTCCSGACVNLKTDEANCAQCGTQCADTQVCAPCKGSCTGQVATCCPKTKRTNCSGTCVNLKTDEANCGKCGKRCRGAKVCKRGRCV